MIVLALAMGLHVLSADLFGGGVKELGPAGVEARRLFEAATPDVQDSVQRLLRAVTRRRR